MKALTRFLRAETIMAEPNNAIRRSLEKRSVKRKAGPNGAAKPWLIRDGICFSSMS